MLLGHDVVADRETKAGPLAGWLRREERLKELILDFRRDARAVVTHMHLDRITEIPRRYLQCWLEVRITPLSLAFGGGIEAIADQIEADPSDVLSP